MKRRLPDYVRPGLNALLVGINPGLRSALLGHHFAGRNNRFWDLLYDAGLTPCRLSFEEDWRLPEFGLGLTNIAGRPTRSSSDLRRRDFIRGGRVLASKITRFKPKCVAFVGVTVYRELVRGGGQGSPPMKISCGVQRDAIEGAVAFVLPNPSGRNAHFRYRDMLRHYRALAHWLERHHA